MNHRWVYDETWKANIRLLWPVDTQTLQNYCLDEFQTVYEGEMTYAKYLLVEDAKGVVTSLIALSYRWEDSNNNLSSLAHECCHAAVAILEDRGMEYHKGNDEPLAYLMDRIYRWALGELRAKKHRK